MEVDRTGYPSMPGPCLKVRVNYGITQYRTVRCVVWKGEVKISPFHLLRMVSGFTVRENGRYRSHEMPRMWVSPSSILKKALANIGRLL